MLRFLRRRRLVERPVPIGTSLADHPELRIRDLLDDPQLRRAMGLPSLEPTADVRPLERRLLERTAA